jgi:hypothetical protein
MKSSTLYTRMRRVWSSTIALRVLETDKKGTPYGEGVYLGHLVSGGQMQRHGPPGWGLDATLTTLICKKKKKNLVSQARNQHEIDRKLQVINLINHR